MRLKNYSLVRLFYANLLFVLFVLCFGLSGCTEFNPVTQKQEMILYSTDKEVNIGRNIAKQVEKDYQTLKDPRELDRITGIADRIAAVCDRKDISYIVTALEAKEEEREDGADINAFSLPGGYVYIFDGLINFVDNDDQLAGVIAHEIAHIVAKHSIKKLQAIMGYTLLSLAAIGTGDADLISGVQYAFVNVLLAYSREDEFTADKLSVRYMKLAGYNPQAMLGFLEKLKDKQKKDPIRAKSIYRTHPHFSARISAIKEELGMPLSFSDYVNKSND